MPNPTVAWWAWFEARKRDEEGQTVIEYALVVAAVSIVLIAALLAFGNDAVSKAQSKLTALVV